MELKYEYRDYKAILSRIGEIGKKTDAITDERVRRAKAGDKDSMAYRCEEYRALWDERHELEEKAEKMRPGLIPEEGMLCTVHLYTDSTGAHVKEVIGPKKTEVVVKCDGLYDFTKTFTLRKNGRWIAKGAKAGQGYTLSLGYRHDYYDLTI